MSVVILTYNSGKYLKRCLDSIFQQTKDIKYEVIVVDNQSPDNSVEVAKTYGNKIRLIISADNGGFAKGNNQGIRAAKGKYVVIANPDTYLVENSLERLFVWMEAHQDYAVLGPELFVNEHTTSSYANASYFPTLPRLLAWAFFLEAVPVVNRLFKAYHQREILTKDTDADWVSGSFFMIRRKAIDGVGMLDENIFMYVEELEWCLRFKEEGWKIAFTPLTKVVHQERGSQQGSPVGAILGEFKGLKYLYGKHYPVWQQVVLGAILDVAAFLRILYWLARLKPTMAKVYLQALAL